MELVKLGKSLFEYRTGAVDNAERLVFNGVHCACFGFDYVGVLLIHKSLAAQINDNAVHRIEDVRWVNVSRCNDRTGMELIHVYQFCEERNRKRDIFTGCAARPTDREP